MGKCRKCGCKGLFFKVNADNLCSDCELEARRSQLNELNSAIADKQKLLDDAIAQAKSEAQARLEKDFSKLKTDYAKQQEEHVLLLAQCNKVREEFAKVSKDLEVTQSKTDKLRPLAKSLKAALSEVSLPNFEVYGTLSTENLNRIRLLDLDELMPEPALNCLTVKDLAARYRSVRKQISEVCSAYEARYTTKTIASMYKLMVLALEAEFENILYKLQFGKLDAGIQSVKELTAKYYAIATDGNQNIAPTLKRFIIQIESLYIDALHIEYEYYVQRERAKEEQRALREQMRQEAEERKHLEQERKKVEAEENKYKQEIERITVQMQSAHDAELAALRKRLEEMQTLIQKVEEKKAEIINLQNGKAGTVYVISNIGSFGENVYKVGMTRRIEPMERVKELGDASVPFPFDVHSFIFSEDAVSLENALHKELNSRRVNKVNLRKEFFNVTIEELQALVEKIDPTAPFKVTALAEQYRQSLSIVDVPENVPVSIDTD